MCCWWLCLAWRGCTCVIFMFVYRNIHMHCYGNSKQLSIILKNTCMAIAPNTSESSTVFSHHHPPSKWEIDWVRLMVIAMNEQGE
jgi:hypothetical protein